VILLTPPLPTRKFKESKPSSFNSVDQQDHPKVDVWTAGIKLWFCKENTAPSNLQY